MSGPQFAHIQTWSRKPNKVGQSVAQIIAEAIREPEFSMHVEDPKPPRLLVGDPAAFEAEHDAHVAARSTRATMSDGQERVRAIRKDRHTLASVVMSYPVPRLAIRDDAARDKLAAWERRNIEWLGARYGAQLRVVMAHDDETHPHLHAWLLADDPGADATTLHPGKIAKREAEAAAKAAGATPAAALRLGNRALKKAMRVWQDDYYRAVGAPEGLTRVGPKRQRLMGAEWRAQKDAATVTAAVAGEMRAEAETMKAEAEAEAARMLAESGAKRAEAEAMQEAEAAQARAWIDGERRRIEDRQAEIQRRQAALAEDARKLATDVAGFDALVGALADGSLREREGGAFEMSNPAPVKAAPGVWRRFLPAVRYIIGLRAEAERDRQAAAECLAQAQAERGRLRSLANKVSLILFKPGLTAEQREVGRAFVEEVHPKERAPRAGYSEGGTPSNTPNR